MSGWLLALRSWDLLGAFAYAQTFAFVESAMLLLVLILLGAFLPARFFRRRFVAQGSAVVFLASIHAVVLQYRPGMILSPNAFLCALASYLVSSGVACVLIRRYERLGALMCAFVGRLTVLLYVYMAVTFLCMIIVVFRNI